MKIIGVHCPYCGGAVKFDVDAGQKSCFCVHCGQQIILDDEVMRTEHVERHIDEARIHEADVNERIRLKELELQVIEQKGKERSKKTKLIISLVYIGILLSSIIICLVSCGINGPDDDLGYGAGMFSMVLFLIGIMWGFGMFTRD